MSSEHSRSLDGGPSLYKRAKENTINCAAETHIKLSKTEIPKIWALGSHCVKFILIAGFQFRRKRKNAINLSVTGAAETHISNCPNQRFQTIGHWAE